MPDIKESLALPIIGGEIFATTYDGKNFSWYIKFVFFGPDARYNAGVANLVSSDIPKLIAALEEALQKMTTLENQSFLGTFSKTMGQIYRPSIELKASNGNVWIDFWVPSGTYRFKRTLKYKDVSIIIEKLKTVEQQAERMIQTLRAIV